jgi:hypothetical protein
MNIFVLERDANIGCRAIGVYSTMEKARAKAISHLENWSGSCVEIREFRVTELSMDDEGRPAFSMTRLLPVDLLKSLNPQRER